MMMMMMMMGPSLVVRIFHHWNAVSSIQWPTWQLSAACSSTRWRQTNRGTSPSRKASRFAAGLNKMY